jgi:hypothetical protein
MTHSESMGGASPSATGLAGLAEEWRAVPGYEGLYEVSNLGCVRSLRFDPPRQIRTGPDKDGYPLVWLFRDGKRSGRYLHRIVCCVFHGDKRNALHKEVAHLDGCRTNARADNLKWASKVENHFHMREHGTHPAGDNHPQRKLSSADVATIRTRAAAGEKPYHLAREYGISGVHARNIVRGERWRLSPEGVSP